jgi:hypothetical protein
MARMTSRYTFNPSFAHAIRIRGLTLTELSRRAEVVLTTTSSAVRCHEVNLTTALRLARAVDAAPVIPELERWALVPASPQQRTQRPSRITQPRKRAADQPPGLVPRRLGRGATGTGMQVAGGMARGLPAQRSGEPAATPSDPADAPSPRIRPTGSARRAPAPASPTDPQTGA